MSPRDSCSRPVLNQPTYSTIASSSCVRVRQTRRLGVVDAGVLAAGVRVVHQRDVGARPSLGERHPQRVEHQRGAHVVSELPAHVRRLKTSITNAKNTTPCQQRR
jgi:hypothetical protein